MIFYSNLTNFECERINISQILISSQFEKPILKTIIWNDPYDSVWLKFFAVIFYIVEVLASLIMFSFVKYETSGLAGHYRTLINQLLSYFYGGVSFNTKTFVDKQSLVYEVK